MSQTPRPGHMTDQDHDRAQEWCFRLAARPECDPQMRAGLMLAHAYMAGQRRAALDRENADDGEIDRLAQLHAVTRIAAAEKEACAARDALSDLVGAVKALGAEGLRDHAAVEAAEAVLDKELPF